MEGFNFMHVGSKIMKLKKHVFAISLGAAMLAVMVLVVSMMSGSKVPLTANSGGTAIPIILASAHSIGAPQSNMAATGAAQPSSIPVPCPVWILSKITGYGQTANQTTDGAAPGPKLVPGGIWLMQKFSDAARKAL